MSKKDIIYLEGKYREVFNNPPGIEVLANMMTEAGFFKENKTYEEMSAENFMKVTLGKMGIWNTENAKRIVQKLMEI